MIILMYLLENFDTRRFATLGSAGVALERFPQYVNQNLRPHSVPVVLFTCVLDGNGTHHMGEQVMPVSAGTVGVTHYGQTHDLLTGPDGVDVVNIYADLEAFDLPIVPAPWDRTLASFLAPHPATVHDQNRRVHLTFSEPDRMAQPLLWMLREQRDNLPGCAAVLSQLFAMFLVECCRIADALGWVAPDDGPEWLGRVRDFIDREYDRPIDLSDMAAKAGVSPEHLCRVFRRHTGLPPVSYLNNRRIQHAIWQLRTTDRPVTEIALDSGFSDISYFNRRFKSATGKSPTQLRAG